MEYYTDSMTVSEFFSIEHYKILFIIVSLKKGCYVNDYVLDVEPNDKNDYIKHHLYRMTRNGFKRLIRELEIN